MRRPSRLRAVLLALVTACATVVAGVAPAQAAPAPAAASDVGPVQLQFVGTGGGPLNIAQRAAYDSAFVLAAQSGFHSSQCRITFAFDNPITGGYWFSTRHLKCVGEPVAATPTRMLYRYLSSRDHLSSVWHVPDGYNREGGLGQLYTSAAPGTHALYLCVVRGDHFLSYERNCEGQEYVTRLGWLPVGPPDGVASLPLYRCLTRDNRQLFESNDPNCESQIVGGPLGYTLAG
ncbi:hypothetical protein [Streptomyces sp. NPDC059452]|uniref:hypothetical protein n=1 Tax=Streptomyces sp. NPDC059452 TaxID=3346835 RepID=UPI003689BEA2